MPTRSISNQLYEDLKLLPNGVWVDQDKKVAFDEDKLEVAFDELRQEDRNVEVALMRSISTSID